MHPRRVRTLSGTRRCCGGRSENGLVVTYNANGACASLGVVRGRAGNGNVILFVMPDVTLLDRNVRG